MTELNVSKLHTELQAEGLPIHGVDSNGEISWHDGHPVAGEEAAAAAVIAAHDPHTHEISPALVFLKGDDIHSITLQVTTDPALESVILLAGGEELPVPLESGSGTFAITSDTPGDEIIITGSGGALPGAEARIYVL
jgi:hypothetical protein